MLKTLFKLFALFATSLLFLYWYLDLHLYLREVPKDFEQAMDQHVEAAKFAGTSVMVFKRGEVVFSKHYGFANIEQQRVADDNTLYQIASVSKLVTATAVMRLYDQGRIDLDDDINAYLPFVFRHPDYPDTAVTFRMLLTHSAGIGDRLLPTFNEFTIGRSIDTELALGDYLKAHFVPSADNDQGREFFNDAKPGTQQRYSNLGFSLLGYLVEQITQQPFDQFCQEAIFDPLGMTQTKWFNRDVDQSLLAMPYGYNAFSETYSEIGLYGTPGYPSGQLKTSTSEFMRFLQVFTSGGLTPEGERFLQASTLAEFMRPQNQDIGGYSSIAWFLEGEPSIYGHGGTNPGVTTNVIISLEEQSGVILFANAGGLLRGWRVELGVEEIRDDLREYVYLYGMPFSQ